MPQVNPTHPQGGGGGVQRTFTSCGQAVYFADGSTSKPLPTAGVIGIGGVSPLGGSCPGVVGSSTDNDGVDGSSTNGNGLSGSSTTGMGVSGNSDSNIGVRGTSSSSWGIWGQTTFGEAAVLGNHAGDGFGVYGLSSASHGVLGVNNRGSGLHPYDDVQQQPFSCGVWGDSYDGCGVFGTSASRFPGVYGRNSGKGYAIYGVATQDGFAGHFEGAVACTGHIHCGDPNNPPLSPLDGSLYVDTDVVLQNGDCAEEFDVVSAQEVEPGTVMVIDEKGALKPAGIAYDKRVAGIISGADACRPAIVLNRRRTEIKQVPLALLGTVYCKVDSQYGPIEVGDLLTTSATPGHAMKATDPLKAFGAVIGKALRAQAAGQGLIPVLVSLQ